MEALSRLLRDPLSRNVLIGVAGIVVLLAGYAVLGGGSSDAPPVKPGTYEPGTEVRRDASPLLRDGVSKDDTTSDQGLLRVRRAAGTVDGVKYSFVNPQPKVREVTSAGLDGRPVQTTRVGSYGSGGELRLRLTSRDPGRLQQILRRLLVDDELTVTANKGAFTLRSDALVAASFFPSGEREMVLMNIYPRAACAQLTDVTEQNNRSLLRACAAADAVPDLKP